MIIYNVTIKADQSIAADWLRWLKEEHIPDIIATGCFSHATVLRLLEIDDSDGPTYAVQYHAAGKSLYDQYISTYAETIRQETTEKWGNKVIAFRSVMEVVH